MQIAMLVQYSDISWKECEAEMVHKVIVSGKGGKGREALGTCIPQGVTGWFSKPHCSVSVRNQPGKTTGILHSTFNGTLTEDDLFHAMEERIGKRKKETKKGGERRERQVLTGRLCPASAAQ